MLSRDDFSNSIFFYFGIKPRRGKCLVLPHASYGPESDRIEINVNPETKSSCSRLNLLHLNLKRNTCAVAYSWKRAPSNFGNISRHMF